MIRTTLIAALTIGFIGCREIPADTSNPAGDLPIAVSELSQAQEGGLGVDTDSESVTTVALESEGLRLFHSLTGSARPIPFGTPMSETMEILTSVQESSPQEEGESSECGGRYATWENGLTLRFSDGAFAGWSVRAGSGALTTASGVGIGSTLLEIEEAYVVQSAETSLGYEFTAGALAGVLDSSGSEGRVIALWAGAVCLAR